VILQDLAEQLFNRFGHDSCTTWPVAEGGGPASLRGPERDLPRKWVRFLFRALRLPQLASPATVYADLAIARAAGWPTGRSSSVPIDLPPTPDLYRQFRQNWDAPECPKCRGWRLTCNATGSDSGSGRLW